MRWVYILYFINERGLEGDRFFGVWDRVQLHSLGG